MVQGFHSYHRSISTCPSPGGETGGALEYCGALFTATKVMEEGLMGRVLIEPITMVMEVYKVIKMCLKYLLYNNVCVLFGYHQTLQEPHVESVPPV